MVITLIGYRGTGKSTVGPQLAVRLGYVFLDADPEIERRAGKSIRQIFADSGEPEFRRLEAEFLAEQLHRNHLVLAPGGGAVLNETTRQRMQSAGPVVWLTAPTDVIVQRMADDATSTERRPALTSLPPRDEIEQLLAKRTPLYAQAASITIETSGKRVDQIVEEILTALPGPKTAAEGART
ncbi:shikimate kinase [Planctomyces sp. SCGC AG-212-M04]|nr:shikimate kinase [Planctomyces sp. SCGC AG-212-M04]